MKAHTGRGSITSVPAARGFAAATILLLQLLLPLPPADAQVRGGNHGCTPDGGLVRLADVSEASGLALSRRTPGRLWSINDSGEPVLFALNGRGQVTARVRVSGAEVEDWEAVAASPCAAGLCLYIGDIGDNQASRKRITVYRLPEPAGGESVAVADAFHAVYPDGAQDAETLLVTPEGAMLIVTKGETGPIGLYRFPRGAKPGATATLERVAGPGATKTAPKSRVTDGAVSADGQWTVLRTGSDLAFHRTADLLAGTWQEVRRVSLESLREPRAKAWRSGPGTVCSSPARAADRYGPAPWRGCRARPRHADLRHARRA